MVKSKVLIYSGGMDSTCLLYDRAEEIALCISFDYGSKHNDREYEFAQKHTKRLGIEHLRIPLQVISEHFESDLLKSGGDIPHGHYEDESMKKTVVPFRNGVMLSIAVGIAESRGLKSVLIANHFGDHAIYPDCRASFVEAFDKATQAGTYEGVRIESPYKGKTKREVAIEGLMIGTPYDDTWSCYEGGEVHCGQCGTCVERKEALYEIDGTEYLA